MSQKKYLTLFSGRLMVVLILPSLGTTPDILGM